MNDPVLAQPAWRITAMHHLSFAVTSAYFLITRSSIVVSSDWTPDPNKRYIVASNHIYFIDPFVCTTALGWKRLRPMLPCRFMASPKFLAKQTLRKPMLWLGSFPSHEFRGWVKGLDAAKIFFEKQQTIVIFPQGKMTNDPHAKTYRGVSELANYDGAMIVPVHLEKKKGPFGMHGYSVVSGEPFDGHGLNPDQIMKRIFSLGSNVQ